MSWRIPLEKYSVSCFAKQIREGRPGESRRGVLRGKRGVEYPGAESWEYPEQESYRTGLTARSVHWFEAEALAPVF